MMGRNKIKILYCTTNIRFRTYKDNIRSVISYTQEERPDIYDITVTGDGKIENMIKNSEEYGERSNKRDKLREKCNVELMMDTKKERR